MLTELLRSMAEIGPGIIWVFIFIAAIVAVFVIYIGITLWATLRATDAEQQKVCYQIFNDLVDLFRRKRRRRKRRRCKECSRRGHK
jgi:hypothetical protein